MRCRPLAILLLALSACSDPTTGSGSDDICTAAADHVASCLGSEPSATPAATCDGDNAELAGQIATTSCDQLKADNKGDGQSGGIGTVACIVLGVPIFAHGLPEDALCCFDYNCEGALVCRKFSCEKQSAVGGPCERENHCEGDLGCYRDRCAPKAAVGGACDRADSCADGLICKDSRCRAPATEGGACTRDDQCTSYHCLGGRCISLSLVGGPCGGTRGLCRPELACDASSNTCVEPPPSNTPCDPNDFFACESGETCWDDLCVRRHKQGEVCNRLFDCDLGLFCTNHVCAP